jgi:hypothetical protein
VITLNHRTIGAWLIPHVCETMNSVSKAALAPSLPAILAASLLLYALGSLVYRLYLHPLAKFPGPRLAAVTSFYEGYFEIVLKGQYSRQISKLHDEYGEYIYHFSLPISLSLLCTILRARADRDRPRCPCHAQRDTHS